MGLRNPFRFPFRADGAMYINDVGQSAREEVDLWLAGADRQLGAAGRSAGGGRLTTDPQPWTRQFSGRRPRQWFIRSQATHLWGVAGDIPVPADYDGNGTADIAVWRPSAGGWFIQGRSVVNWGLPGDIPVPADYDGNGTADLAVWRPSVGGWFIQGQPVVNWGLPGDLPVPGNFDSTASDEIAVYRQSSGQWFVRNLFTVNFGLEGDVPANLPAAITANFMD